MQKGLENKIQVSLNPKLPFPFYWTAFFKIIYWNTEMAPLNKTKFGKSDKSSY